MPWIVDARDALQAGDEAGHEGALVVRDGHHARHQLASPLARRVGARRSGDIAVRPADVAQVVGRRQRAGDRFERLRPGLEPVDRGPDLERGQPIEDLGLPVQRAEVRPEPLVDRRHEEVGVEGPDVDRPVRRVGDRIDVGHRPDLVGALDDGLDRVDRADRIAGVAHGHEPRPRPELRLEVLEVEGDVVGPDVDLVDGDAAVGGHRLPGGDVRLVIEGRDDDLVPRPERRPDAAPDVEREARHVLAELDLIGRGGAHEVGDGGVGLLDDRVRELARRERALRGSRSCRGSTRRRRRSPAAGPGCRPGRRGTRPVARRSRERGPGTRRAGHRHRTRGAGIDPPATRSSGRAGVGPSVPQDRAARRGPMPAAVRLRAASGSVAIRPTERERPRGSSSRPTR